MRTRVRVGVDIEGKAIYKHVSGTTTDALQRNIVKAFIESGRIEDVYREMGIEATQTQPTKKSKTFTEVAEAWKHMHDGRLEGTTKTSQDSIIRKHILPFFGEMLIDEISIEDVQEFLETRQKNGEYLARGTIANIWVRLQMILDYAVECQYIPVNPARSKQLFNPSDGTRNMEYLTMDELLDIRKAVPFLRNENERLYMTFMCYTTCCKGEAMGICWEDVNFDAKELTVSGTVGYTNGQPKHRPGQAKNKYRLRTFPCEPEFFELLKPYRKAEGLIITDGGKLFQHNRFNDMWQSIQDQIPLVKKKGITSHRFRSAVATALHNVSKDIPAVGAMCGHAPGSNMTAKRYIKTDKRQKQAVIDAMQAAACAG